MKANEVEDIPWLSKSQIDSFNEWLSEGNSKHKEKISTILAHPSFFGLWHDVQKFIATDNETLVKYDRLAKAIAEYHAVDEVKNIRDKAIDDNRLLELVIAMLPRPKPETDPQRKNRRKKIKKILKKLTTVIPDMEKDPMLSQFTILDCAELSGEPIESVSGVDRMMSPRVVDILKHFKSALADPDDWPRDPLGFEYPTLPRKVRDGDHHDETDMLIRLANFIEGKSAQSREDDLEGIVNRTVCFAVGFAQIALGRTINVDSALVRIRKDRAKRKKERDRIQPP